jgi:small subunit ribosomal protein S4
MARYIGPKVKVIRRLQTQLVGLTNKSGKRAEHAPGQHGRDRRVKMGDYRVRMCEKQKIRFNYGLSEKQLRNCFQRAANAKGDTGQNLLVALESRLDNVVFRAGFARSIPAARQLVTHAHIRVNDKKVNIPSYLVKVGDVISLREKSQNLLAVKDCVENPTLSIPAYMSVDKTVMQAKIGSKPGREDVPLDIQDNLIVEYYSRIA